METFAMKGEKGTGVSPEETGVPYRLVPDGNRITVFAELPKVNEERIRLDLEKRTLVITVMNRGDHRTRIELPFTARLRAKRFSGGTLEITLERAGRRKGDSRG